MGSRILAGRYELQDKIGEGGMAVVFKARDRLLSRFVAIKILRPEYTKDAMFIESFRRESQIAAGLVHPNIVNVYDVGKEGNIYYIVMELIEGRPLSDIIKEEGPLDPYREADIYVLCSDGLTDMLSDEEIARVLSEPGSLEERLERLREKVFEKGAADNTTVFLIEVDRSVMSGQEEDR